MSSPQQASFRSHMQQIIDILEQTYPAWRIRRRYTGMWCAVREISPTMEQADAGLHRYIIQPSMEALAAVLAKQLEIAQRVRY